MHCICFIAARSTYTPRPLPSHPLFHKGVLGKGLMHGGVLQVAMSYPTSHSVSAAYQYDLPSASRTGTPKNIRWCPARERAGPVVVIRLACPGVSIQVTTCREGRRGARKTWFGQNILKHASGNGASGRVGLDLLPTFTDMVKVGPGGWGWKPPRYEKLDE
jgi:hypothetical protein